MWKHIHTHNPRANWAFPYFKTERWLWIPCLCLEGESITSRISMKYSSANKPMIASVSDVIPCSLNFGSLLCLTATPLTPDGCWPKWRNQSHSSHTIPLLVKQTIINGSYMAKRQTTKSTVSYSGFSFFLLPLFSSLLSFHPPSLCAFLRHSDLVVSLVTSYLANPSPWDFTFS